MMPLYGGGTEESKQASKENMSKKMFVMLLVFWKILRTYQIGDPKHELPFLVRYHSIRAETICLRD